jgi:hypothetical protein
MKGFLVAAFLVAAIIALIVDHVSSMPEQPTTLGVQWKTKGRPDQMIVDSLIDNRQGRRTLAGIGSFEMCKKDRARFVHEAESSSRPISLRWYSESGQFLKKSEKKCSFYYISASLNERTLLYEEIL